MNSAPQYILLVFGILAAAEGLAWLIFPNPLRRVAQPFLLYFTQPMRLRLWSAFILLLCALGVFYSFPLNNLASIILLVLSLLGVAKGVLFALAPPSSKTLILRLSSFIKKSTNNHLRILGVAIIIFAIALVIIALIP